jgi:methyltransferase
MRAIRMAQLAMLISPRVYLVILAALAAERLGELALSRRNARRAFDRRAVETGVAHYWAMVAVHALFLVACAAEAIFIRRRVPAAVQLAALVAALGAQALRYWAVRTLGDRWNTRIIVIPGAEPVTAGPYRFMRHPNYLAVAIEIAAVPVIGGAYASAIAFSIANAVLLAIRIPAEERALGAQYAERLGARPRFIPLPRRRT